MRADSPPAPCGPHALQDAAPEPLLSCHGFGVGFGERVILEGLDFELASGHLAVLSGPPASGKSTLLRSLAGLHRRNGRFRCWGEARFKGRPLEAAPAPVLVRQDVRLMRSRVLDTLIEAVRARPKPPHGSSRQHLREELHALGVEQILDTLSSRAVELPPVLQRTVPIVAAALRRTPLVLLDDPTARLSGADAQSMLALIRTVSRRCTVLLATQDRQLALQLDAQRLQLEAGRMARKPRIERRTGAMLRTPAGLAPGEGPARPGAPASPPPPDPPAPAPANAVRKHSPAKGVIRFLTHSSGIEMAEKLLAEPMAEPRGPAGFSWVIPGRLAAALQPGASVPVDEDLAALRRAGVTRLVTLTRQDLPQDALARHGMANLHLPVRDNEPPTVAQTNMLLIRAQGLLDGGEVLAVHGANSMGRTGTVLAAWLIREGGLTASEATHRLCRLDPRFRPSPEQDEFLHEYELSFFKYLN